MGDIVPKILYFWSCVPQIAESPEGELLPVRPAGDGEIQLGSRAVTGRSDTRSRGGRVTIEVPELPGVVTGADSVAEARTMTAEAAGLWLDASSRTTRRRAIR